MSIWDALTGRIYAWNSATQEFLAEVTNRAKAPASTAPVGHFRKWYYRFFLMMQAQLHNAFEDKQPMDKFYWERVKAYNKETFRTLHAVFLCSHLHVIREGLEDSVTGMIDEAGQLLDMSQTRLHDLFKSYEDKQGAVPTYMHTWRLFCQTIGANDTDNFLSMEPWIQRIRIAAEHAHQEHPLIEGGSVDQQPDPPRPAESPVKPVIPDVKDEAAVVDWFLKYDDKLAYFRSGLQPAGLDFVRQEILGDLKEHSTAEALDAKVQKVSTYYTDVAHPAMAQRIAQGEPFNDPEFTKLALTEILFAAKMRVLGYFLLKRHGIQPE